MASSSKISFKKFVAEEMGGFPHFFAWAILEWILIASLYMDGFLALFSSTLAKFFKLEPPCVLCTRVDHVLMGKEPNTYYNDSICECHKKDISSLAYCHVHRKLSDIQNMCEGCLISFATEKDECKKMVLKPVNDSNNHFNDDMVDTKRCSCCDESFKPKNGSKSYVGTFSSVCGSTLAPINSPRAISSPIAQCFTPTWKNEDPRYYTEVKFVADFEPDTSEYDFGSNIDARKVREEMKTGTITLLQDSEELNDESCKTPDILKSSKFFGISLTDTSVASSRFANEPTKITFSEKHDLLSEKRDLLSETNDVSSGDGDSSVEQLKKQAILDQKSLKLLTTELEEERSASAVAANNAMAMITRLQAEKAAVQMETLQYQRMMEEQAEYDQEAIQTLQDELVKQDEHIRVLETELENYREKHGEIKKVGSDECEADVDDYYQEWKSQSSSDAGSPRDYVEPVSPFGNEPASPFEKKFVEPESPLGRDGDHDYKDGERSMENMKDDEYEEPLMDFESERDQLYSMLKNLENQIEDESDGDWDDEDKDHKDEENRATLKREVSLIRGRLRALEADSGFLKHTAITLA